MTWEVTPTRLGLPFAVCSHIQTWHSSAAARIKVAKAVVQPHSAIVPTKRLRRGLDDRILIDRGG